MVVPKFVASHATLMELLRGFVDVGGKREVKPAGTPFMELLVAGYLRDARAGPVVAEYETYVVYIGTIWIKGKLYRLYFGPGRGVGSADT